MNLRNKLAFWLALNRYIEMVVSGVAPLSLPSAVAGELVGLKAFGGTEQNGTATPTNPVDITCNNGVLKFKDKDLPDGYKRILGMTMNDNCYYQITDFKMNGSDTLRFAFTRTGTSACNVIGAYDGSSARTNYSLYAAAPTGAYLRYNGGAYNSSTVAGTRYDVVITPTGTSGMRNNSTWTAKTFTSATDLCIGTTSPTATSTKMIGSIHGNVVVDGRLQLIPCERVSDGEIGYYDTYTGTFYEPIGTRPTSVGYDDSQIGVHADGLQETIAIKDDQSATISTATCEDLLSIGTYTDEQEVISGNVTRKVAVLVLDGTENWASTGDAYGCGLRQTDYGYLSGVAVLCSHFPYSTSSSTAETDVVRNQTGAFALRILADSTIIPDNSTGPLKVASLKQWLADQYAAGTPVILVYPLTTATTETVAGQPMSVVSGDNTAEITQASMGGLRLEVTYKKQG